MYNMRGAQYGNTQPGTEWNLGLAESLNIVALHCKSFNLKLLERSIIIKDIIITKHCYE